MKRGFCFVFLKDPPNIEEKRRCEDFIEEINGMYVSRQLLSTTPAPSRFHRRSSFFVRTLSWRGIEPSFLPPLRFCLWNFWDAMDWIEHPSPSNFFFLLSSDGI